MPRDYVPLRVSADALAQVDAIAETEAEGNRSATLRRLLSLGLAAWQQGCRVPDDVMKKR